MTHILLTIFYVIPVAFCLGYATLQYKLKEALFKSNSEKLGRYFTKKPFQINDFLVNMFLFFCPFINIVVCVLMISDGKKESILRDVNLEDK